MSLTETVVRMIYGIVDALKSNLNLIALTGLILDATGALLVLGPEVPTVQRVGTYLERRKMNRLYDKLEREGHLSENVEPFNRLLEEMWVDHPIPWDVEELVVEDNRVVMGEKGLPDGKRTGRYKEDLENWIEDYRGVDREYYLAGGGLLLMGFLFQIVAKVSAINETYGLIVLVITLGVGVYLLYRGRDYVWWLPSD